MTKGLSAHGWGKHHALITRVDKPSLAQVGPYPTPTLPYPTLPPTLPYPTPNLPYPYPYSNPYLYHYPYPTHLASLPFKRKFNLSNGYCVRSRFYQWYTNIVQGSTNGTIGKITNSTIGKTSNRATVRVFYSGTSDCRNQCSRVGLEVKLHDTPAGGINTCLSGHFF